MHVSKWEACARVQIAAACCKDILRSGTHCTVIVAGGDNRSDAGEAEEALLYAETNHISAENGEALQEIGKERINHRMRVSLAFCKDA